MEETETAEPERLQRLADELRSKQNNVLPPDLIANDHSVDDVLWNGPTTRKFGIERAGAFVVGVMLFSFALAATSMLYQKGARLFLAPSLVIAAAGLRVIYKSFAGRSVAKAREDRLTESGGLSE